MMIWTKYIRKKIKKVKFLNKNLIKKNKKYNKK